MCVNKLSGSISYLRVIFFKPVIFNYQEVTFTDPKQRIYHCNIYQVQSLKKLGSGDEKESVKQMMGVCDCSLCFYEYSYLFFIFYTVFPIVEMSLLQTPHPISPSCTANIPLPLSSQEKIIHQSLDFCAIQKYPKLLKI